MRIFSILSLLSFGLMLSSLSSAAEVESFLSDYVPNFGQVRYTPASNTFEWNPNHCIVDKWGEARICERMAWVVKRVKEVFEEEVVKDNGAKYVKYSLKQLGRGQLDLQGGWYIVRIERGDTTITKLIVQHDMGEKNEKFALTLNPDSIRPLANEED